MMVSIALWIAAGFVFGTLVEYFVHRAMHWGWLFARRHREHHRDGWGQGVWPELFTYVAPGVPLVLPPYLIDLESGLGWTGGCIAFALFASYGHQLQHDTPAACRWMPMPVHYVHHRDQMWHHNFGLSVDWWDRVFGTYRTVDTDELRATHDTAGWLDVGWWGPLRTQAPWRHRARSL